MKWMRERDALIAQTLAFVQSVASRKDAGEPPAVLPPEPAPTPSPPADPPLPAFPAIAEPAKSPEPAALAASTAPQPIVPSDFQRELTSRIASFRAHQERFNREREEYSSATLARLRAAIKDGPQSPRPRG